MSHTALRSPTPRRLASLLADVPRETLRVFGGLEASVDHASLDSREVGPGGLFVATRGSSWDGHAFIAKALEAGARAVLAEDAPPAGLELGERTWIQVPDAQLALAHLSAAWFDHPGEHVAVLATTGTNGKTTTSYLLREILRHAGLRSGLISTVEILVDRDKLPTIFTTPPSPEFQGLLAAMRDAGCSHAVVEASSHGLHQRRIAAFEVAVAGFTNLTRDHLDYHGDMASYEAAKAILFEELAHRAAINVDDPAGRRFAERFAARPGTRLLTVSPSGHEADLSAVAARSSLDGIDATIAVRPGTPGCGEGASFALHLPLIGRHNLENGLVALGMALLAGLPLALVVEALATATGAPGRLQKVPGEGPAVFVDYAHTPDALENVLGALRPLVPGRLVCVFGAGGDRDKGKRPQMAAVAARLADVVVVTSDNPRTEDPEAILDDIVAGLPAGAAFTRLVDRREAIAHAVALAGPGDAVLVAGKGHEDYQIVGTTKHPFDDVAVARAALLARQGGTP